MFLWRASRASGKCMSTSCGVGPMRGPRLQVWMTGGPKSVEKGMLKYGAKLFSYRARNDQSSTVHA